MTIFLRFLQLLLRPAFWLPAPAALWLVHGAGEIVYQIARLTPVKKSAAANFRKVFPAADGAQLADKLLRNTAYSIFELLCLPYFRTEHFDRLCKIVGRANLDLALANGQGSLFLTMHTGNYELVPALFSQLGYKVTSIVKSPAGPLFKLIDSCRTSHGTRQINVLDSNMYREALKALNNNEIVGLLIDTGANESRNETIDFLGKKVLAATGWLALAQRSEASLVLCTCKREGKDLVVSLTEPFTAGPDTKARVSEHFEVFIKSHPDQWAMFLNNDEVNRLAEGG